jgi:hypothetical protein
MLNILYGDLLRYYKEKNYGDDLKRIAEHVDINAHKQDNEKARYADCKN